MTELEIEICSANVRLLMFGECSEPRDSFCNTDEFIPLDQELEEYKVAPNGFIKYPSDVIKYWAFLFKHRDHCRFSHCVRSYRVQF